MRRLIVFAALLLSPLSPAQVFPANPSNTMTPVGQARLLRVVSGKQSRAQCDMNLVLHGTPPKGDTIGLPATPVKIFFQPLSVNPKSDCVRNLRVHDSGTMKLEKQFQGDKRFELMKNREEADYVFSIVMLNNKNVAVLVSQGIYNRAVQWSDSHAARVDLYELWSNAIWRSNQANQRMKSAGVAVITYGLYRDVGNKSAAELIALFKSDFGDFAE